MNLLWRVARLERETLPPPTACPKCSRTYIWGVPDDRLDDPTWKPVCDVCGKSPEHGYVKLIAQSMLDEL